MNGNLFLRILIAVFAVVLIFALLQPVAHVLGLTLSSDLLLIFKLCIAGIALFYIVTGSPK
jgi:hypothetical protein